MSVSFRPAVRANVGLLIGLAGASGSGKTYTAMRLARGIAGNAPFAVIDTEAGRATHYADAFRFDHADLAPPFRPERYAEAIVAADKAGYPVIVLDSMSHVWAGDGGVLDWQEEELTRMAGDDWKKREAVKMAAWIRPKVSHKHMVAKLLQVRAHLILCFRAEPKVEMVNEKKELLARIRGLEEVVADARPSEAEDTAETRRLIDSLRAKLGGADDKMKIVPKRSGTGLDGWMPICEKNLPYELTASFLLTADAPGVPKPIKLQEQHKALFPTDRAITEESGRRIAEWARGGVKLVPTPNNAPTAAAPQEQAVEPSGDGAAPEYITPQQEADLHTLCIDNDIPTARLKVKAGVESLDRILAADYERALTWVKRTIADRNKATA